jgi:hypothetical protein
MVHLPSIPKVVHRQNAGVALYCQVLSAQVFTRILGKNPIPERRVTPLVRSQATGEKIVDENRIGALGLSRS